VRWDVDLHDAFVPEFDALDEAVQDELLAYVAVLETFGPQLTQDAKASSCVGATSPGAA
jgi:hypothetical protein